MKNKILFNLGIFCLEDATVSFINNSITDSSTEF